jgi:DNA recombination protein RmuC
VALLKAVAYGWRQSAVAQNAAEIRDLGQELYRRLGNFEGHLSKMGQRLSSAVDAYNAAVGSLERQVLPQARRFTELGVTTNERLATLEPIGQLLRATAGASAAQADAAVSAAEPAAPAPEPDDARQN